MLHILRYTNMNSLRYMHGQARDPRNGSANSLHFQTVSQLVFEHLSNTSMRGASGPLSFSALECVPRSVPTMKHMFTDKMLQNPVSSVPTIFSLRKALSECQLSKLEKLVLFLSILSPHTEERHTRELDHSDFLSSPFFHKAVEQKILI